MAITIYDYLASKKPQESFEVLVSTGKSVPYPRNSSQLAQMLKQYVQMGGENALMILAQIHPDKDLIEAIVMDAIKKKNEDFECPICLEIIAEPMRTPCNHLFCLSCQKQSILLN